MDAVDRSLPDRPYLTMLIGLTGHQPCNLPRSFRKPLGPGGELIMAVRFMDEGKETTDVMLAWYQSAAGFQVCDSQAHCWEVTQCKDTQQTRFPTSAIPDDHQLSTV